jgi:DNA-binding HxlR family transcriptional regulator
MACSLEARVGLKSRRDYKVAPPKVEYKLTATGNPVRD